MNKPYFLLLALVLIFACSDPRPAEPHAAFFASLGRLCGASFVGAMTFPTEGPHDFAGKKLVAKLAQCEKEQLRVPFTVGDDTSRTWVFTLDPAGLTLQHDHRHADGSPDPITLYGGQARPGGSAYSQSFPADAYTAQLIPAAATNVWTVSLSEDNRTLTYHLERDGKPRFTAVLQRVE